MTRAAALLVAIATLSACDSAERAYMYTCDVQFVDFRWDQTEPRGTVDANRALEEFRRFPFKEQLRKAATLREPTFPTVSFKSSPDAAALAIWSLKPDHYEVYYEQPGRKVTIESSDLADIERTIQRFFSGERSSLYSDLARYPGAVTVRSILDRLKALFGQ